MKIKYITILLLIIINGLNARLPKLKNPFQDDLTRNNQPQEHIIIPLINTQEADYNPFVAPDIREYRKASLQPDKDIEFQVKMSK
jgi:hypothetical protein